ncbi:MAG: UPF0280 family protein [Candidatus Methanomethylophilus sp.]|nr:UPF0280 family protein [Methanomethylophilus sp.]
MNTERRRIVMGETCIDAVTDHKYLSEAEALAAEARTIVTSKIENSPEFGSSYKPVKSRIDDVPLISRMCTASELAGVGPMASVAGAVATYVLNGLIRDGCEYAVLDNGGDVALISDREVFVGLFTGRNDLECALHLTRTCGILGVCSSSGTFGHSISFGRSDICSVISEDPILADACATRLGNLVSETADLQPAAEYICTIKGVKGCIASIAGNITICGDVPELVSVGQENHTLEMQ